ncbi:MAG: heme biosynthesis protein HemY [Gammaproteobacteria bacterium]|nr:heme biosynthesis protein HemY [Gammaproteobacteria bacterium]MBT8109684.1 heme biosynthesis protein HemY [Gammaproteobacteria bacterium]NND46504.1 heme biosynthesis protein HemY [Woeseiaceae bacterium]NNL44388.1 heme biosynthesis protein HemY [Woeseiaceae bacterium]
MKFGIFVVLVLFASAFAAHFLLADPGYVIINFRGYVVEMSVPVLVGFAVLLLFSVWLIRKIVLAPKRLGEAAGRYRSARSGKKMTRGMIAVAEGNFARGEKMLARAASTSDSPLFNYLQAARAAHLQGRDDRRDEWLRLAFQETPEAANAVLLTQAEFQLDRGQNEQALATLRRLDENSKDHAHALALLGRLYFKLEDWDSLAELLPRLRKSSQLKAETLDNWTIRVHKEMLNRTADSDAVAETWKTVSRAHKSNATLLEAYYDGLMRAGQHDRVEKELAATLKSNWSGPLVRLFGLVEASDTTKQLKRAESWLKKHGDDPDLLLAAARLCLRNELWGKARSYLETVISLRPSPEAYREYGALLNQMGEADAAAAAYRDGLGMVSAEPLTAIPHMDAAGKR